MMTMRLTMVPMLVLMASALIATPGARAGEVPADDLADVPYAELIERGLAQSRAQLDSGALFYLRVAALRTEAKTDPQVFAALAYLERKACRLDIALRQARRADEIAQKTESPLRRATARLHREIERGSGWVTIDLGRTLPESADGTKGEPGSPASVTEGPSKVSPGSPPVTATGDDGATAAPPGTEVQGAEARDDEKDLAPFVELELTEDGQAPGPLIERAPDDLPVDPACGQRAETLLAAGIARSLAADDATETVQLRLPLGTWRVAGRSLMVTAGGEASLMVVLLSPETGVSGATWAAVIGGGVAVAALATVGAIVFAPADTDPTLGSDFVAKGLKR